MYTFTRTRYCMVYDKSLPASGFILSFCSSLQISYLSNIWCVTSHVVSFFVLAAAAAAAAAAAVAVLVGLFLRRETPFPTPSTLNFKAPCYTCYTQP